MSDVPVGVEVSTTAGVCVVSFRDGTVLDSLSVQQIGRQLYALADERPARHILVDCENIRFLSSQALGVLVNFRKRAESGGVQIVLAGLRPELRRVLELTKLDKVFALQPTRQAALEQLGGGRGASPGE
jgi:anti-anti-sigma factor